MGALAPREIAIKGAERQMPGFAGQAEDQAVGGA